LVFGQLRFLLFGFTANIKLGWRLLRQPCWVTLEWRLM